MSIKPYIQLARPKHYLKNGLILLPLIFGGSLFNKTYLMKAVYSFVAFSLAASVVYVMNDLRDRELDIHHATKKNRPIASGRVSVGRAIIFMGILTVGVGVFQYLTHSSLISLGVLLAYVVINVAYSFGLKNIPIVDVTILSLGFVLRVVYGGYTVGIDISKWLYLAVLAFSFYLGLGKRRNEIIANGHKTRRVNKHYNQEFLDKNMYVCLGLTIVYYSLWAIDPSQKHALMYLTIPLVIAIVMTYSLAIEKDNSDGDPVSVVLGNKALLGLVVLYAALVTSLVYI